MNEIFSDPLFLKNDKIWSFLTGETGNFNAVSSLFMNLDEGVVVYFIFISFILCFYKRVNFLLHLGLFGTCILIGDFFPSQYILHFLGGILNNSRIYNLNGETFRHLIAFILTIPLIILAFKKHTRSVSRVVFAASGVIIFLTTFVFHILYFHTLQAVALNSHTNHAKMITLLDDNEFEQYCNFSNLACYSGERKEELSKVEDRWIRNYVIEKLAEIESIRSYEIRDISFEIMKTNIVGGGARTGYFKKNDKGWKVVINQDSVKSFSRALELTFWVQMVIAHYIWVSLSLFVIFAHERRVFKKNHIIFK